MYIFDKGMEVKIIDFDEKGIIEDVKVGCDNNTLYEVKTPDGVSAWFLATELKEA